MFRIMHDMGSRCAQHTVLLKYAILKAWDSAVKEIKNKWVKHISQNPLHYNVLDRVLFALDKKENNIKHQLVEQAEALGKIALNSINDFEQKVKSLVAEEKQKWMDAETVDVNNLSDEDLRIYQALTTNLSEEMKAEWTNSHSFCEKDPVELIGSFVFDTDFLMDPEELVKSMNSIDITPLIVVVATITTNEAQLFLDRIKTKPEVLWQKHSDEMAEKLRTKGYEYIEKKCDVYEKRAKRIQKWIAETGEK